MQLVVATLTIVTIITGCGRELPHAPNMMGNGHETPSPALITAIKLTCEPHGKDNTLQDSELSLKKFSDNRASYLTIGECYIMLLSQTAAESTMGADYSGEYKWGSHGGRVRGLTQSRYTDAKAMALPSHCHSDGAMRTPYFNSKTTWADLGKSQRNVICNLSTGWRQLTQKVGNHLNRKKGCLERGLRAHLGPNSKGWYHYKRAFQNLHRRLPALKPIFANPKAFQEKVNSWDKLIKKGCDRHSKKKPKVVTPRPLCQTNQGLGYGRSWKCGDHRCAKNKSDYTEECRQQKIAGPP